MLGEIQWLYSTIVDRCPAMPTSEMGHPRPGRARSRSGQVRDASKAEVISKHERLRDGPLRFDARPWANITLGAGCSGRGGARRRTALTRRVKSCGPGAPTLASSSRGGNPLERRWQESPVTGETTKETVKTTAQGMPVDCGVPVVTTLVCFPFLHARLSCAFHFCTRGYGCELRIRHSLRPLLSRVIAQQLGRYPRRENAGRGSSLVVAHSWTGGFSR